MHILARFTNFCDFYHFWKAVATAFFRISEIPMVNVEIHSFSFYLFKTLGYKIKDFSAMLGGRKRNSYVITVWSGKTVLEMFFVESTSLTRPIYIALRLKPLTESDCRVVSHDSKNVYNFTAYCCLTPTTPHCSKFSLFRFLRRVQINHLRPYLFALMASV